MPVESDKIATTESFQGRACHFCFVFSHDQFHKPPERYTKKEDTKPISLRNEQ